MKGLIAALGVLITVGVVVVCAVGAVCTFAAGCWQSAKAVARRETVGGCGKACATCTLSCS